MAAPSAAPALRPLPWHAARPLFPSGPAGNDTRSDSRGGARLAARRRGAPPAVNNTYDTPQPSPPTGCIKQRPLAGAGGIHGPSGAVDLCPTPPWPPAPAPLLICLDPISLKPALLCLSSMLRTALTPSDARRPGRASIPPPHPACYDCPTHLCTVAAPSPPGAVLTIHFLVLHAIPFPCRVLPALPIPAQAAAAAPICSVPPLPAGLPHASVSAGATLRRAPPFIPFHPFFSPCST